MIVDDSGTGASSQHRFPPPLLGGGGGGGEASTEAPIRKIGARAQDLLAGGGRGRAPLAPAFLELAIDWRQRSAPARSGKITDLRRSSGRRLPLAISRHLLINAAQALARGGPTTDSIFTETVRRAPPSSRFATGRGSPSRHGSIFDPFHDPIPWVEQGSVSCDCHGIVSSRASNHRRQTAKEAGLFVSLFSRRPPSHFSIPRSSPVTSSTRAAASCRRRRAGHRVS